MQAKASIQGSGISVCTSRQQIGEAIVIKISFDDEQNIQVILQDYQSANFDFFYKEMSPILHKYFPIEPIKISKRLLNNLFSSWLSKSKESIVHYWTICKLIEEYGYPTEQIDHEVSCGGLGRQALNQSTLGSAKADIVVYSHSSRRSGTALIAIECREFDGVDGAKQAASYSRALQAAFHLFTDSNRWSAFETQPYPDDGVAISDIPHWIGAKPLTTRLSKSHKLPPVTDEKQLRDLVKICHDEIHSEGIDPAKAFDELVKLFFVKVYDEQEIPDEYMFSVLAGECDTDTSDNIRSLLRDAKENSQYKELFSEPGDDEFWIHNKSIRKVVETFQGFSFTGSSVIGIDAKGTVYENMVGSTFRGELGQYFTPRKIVEFMVDLLEPTRDDIVLDPSCGSGGFLIYVMEKIAAQIRQQQQNLTQHRIEQLIHNIVIRNIKGTDISPRMVRTTRMNMIMHGDGWSGIQRCHGLQIHKHDSFSGDSGKFTLILSNPPFAKFETDEAILSEFEMGKNKNGNVRGIHRAIIFVEQIIRLLAEGGRAGIVLPRSIFENESYSFKMLRKLIFRNCEVLAVVGLPRTAFHHTDCGILGDLLFLRKTSKPRADYKVFVGWAENVGYNTLGHNIEKNDFPDILENYRNKHEDYRSGFSLVPISKLQEEDNINPWYYHPEAEILREGIEANRSRSLPLSELVSIYQNKISKSALRQTPDRIIQYVEVRDVNPKTGTFTPTERRASELPSRATYELNGDELILLPNARNSLESGRQIIKVAEETKGLVLTNRYLPLYPNVNADYLVMMLNTSFVRDQLISVCRGAGSPDFRENKLKEIMVPVPNSTDLSSIDAFMEDISDKLALKKQLESKVEKVSRDIKKSLESLIEE